LRRLIRRLAVTIDQFGKDDQTLGCGANVIRGITGDQRELWVICWFDDADVFRHYDLASGNFEGKSAAAAADLYLVEGLK